MNRLLLLSLLLLASPSLALAKDPSFLNDILQSIDSKEESFADSFSQDPSFYQESNPVVRYSPGPSKTPFIPKTNQLTELVDNLKSIVGATQNQHRERLVDTIEKSFGTNYSLPFLPKCTHSRIITREARLSSLMPDSVDYLYFDGAARSERPKTYSFGSHAIAYENERLVGRSQENIKLPLYLAEIIGITCLPTYVRTVSPTDIEFHEGEAAWQAGEEVK